MLVMLSSICSFISSVSLSAILWKSFVVVIGVSRSNFPWPETNSLGEYADGAFLQLKRLIHVNVGSMYSTKFNETSFDQLSSVADMRTSVGRFQSAVAKLVCRYRVD